MPTFPLPLSSRRGRAPARLFLAAALLLGGLSQAAASSLTGAWRINANGFTGEVALQQAPDGTLGGSVFGNPLTGFHAPGERTVVWLRGAPAQPDQAYVGTLGADGASVSGRLYALTVSGGGGSTGRNVFAFTALRGAAAPGHPGVPAAAAGPASVAGTLALTANNIPGALVLTQAADGTLGGSIYGDRIGGHYAAGTGTIAFLRYSGAQPVQLYVGTVAAQGIEGEFYALTVPAGGSAQRMRYAWRAQLPQAAAQQAAPPAQAQQPAPPAPLPAAPALRPLPAPAVPAAMPSQPAAPFNPSSTEEAALAPYPRGFDIAPGGRRYDGFAVGQPGPVRVMVRSAQPVVVALRRPDGRMVERAGSGDLAIDDTATEADVRASLLWGVSIRPQQAQGAAQGQIHVTHPPADPQAVQAELQRERQAAMARAEAALLQTPAAAVDPNAAAVALQRELDQQTLARHSKALQALRAQLHPDTAAVMAQAQQARAQGQPLSQAQQAMASDARIARLVGASVLSPDAQPGGAFVAPSRGRLLAPPSAATGTQGDGGAAPAGATSAGTAPASGNAAQALKQMFKNDGAGAPQQAGTRPLVTSTSVAEGDPGTPVMIQGNHFGAERGTVRFIVANGRDLPAPITFWSATQIVTEVPAVEGVREYAGQVYVRRADGAQSELRPFAFKPAMERRQIFPEGDRFRYTDGTGKSTFADARIHPYGLVWAGPPVHDPHLFNPHVVRFTLLFGGSGRDEFFLTSRLANGWRVESCVVGHHIKGVNAPYVIGSATVTVTHCPVGSDILRTAVDWWFDFRSHLIYSLSLIIVGPKGVPHQ